MKALSQEIQNPQVNHSVFYNVQLTVGIPKNELETAMSSARRALEEQNKMPDISQFNDQDCVRELVIQSIRMKSSPFTTAGFTVTDQDVSITPMNRERKMGLENLLIEATASLEHGTMTSDQKRAKECIMEARHMITHTDYISEATVQHEAQLHAASP